MEIHYVRRRGRKSEREAGKRISSCRAVATATACYLCTIYPRTAVSFRRICFHSSQMNVVMRFDVEHSFKLVRSCSCTHLPQYYTDKTVPVSSSSLNQRCCLPKMPFTCFVLWRVALLLSIFILTHQGRGGAWNICRTQKVERGT